MIRVRTVQKAVCQHFGVSLIDLVSQRRPVRLVEARHVAMWLAKNLTEYSLPQIGAAFGGRDHTTVLHAVRKVDAQRAADPEFASLTGDLLAGLMAAARIADHWDVEIEADPIVICQLVLATPRNAVSLSVEDTVLIASELLTLDATLRALVELDEEPPPAPVTATRPALLLSAGGDLLAAVRDLDTALYGPRERAARAAFKTAATHFEAALKLFSSEISDGPFTQGQGEGPGHRRPAVA